MVINLGFEDSMINTVDDVTVVNENLDVTDVPETAVKKPDGLSNSSNELNDTIELK